MRLFCDLRPFRVVAEGVPCSSTLVGILERDHVGEFVIAFSDVSGPVTDVLDAVLFEQLHRVVSEASVDIWQTAGETFVHAKFVEQRIFLWSETLNAKSNR